jgi:hypothetical protein
MAEDESGAYVMFAVAIPVPMYGRAARLLACAASATSISDVSSAAVEHALEYFLTENSSAAATEGPQLEVPDEDTHDDSSFGALLNAEHLILARSEEAQRRLAKNSQVYMQALWESNLLSVAEMAEAPIDGRCWSIDIT